MLHNMDLMQQRPEYTLKPWLQSQLCKALEFRLPFAIDVCAGALIKAPMPVASQVRQQIIWFQFN